MAAMRIRIDSELLASGYPHRPSSRPLLPLSPHLVMLSPPHRLPLYIEHLTTFVETCNNINVNVNRFCARDAREVKSTIKVLHAAKDAKVLLAIRRE